jgi:hypothetical protein
MCMFFSCPLEETPEPLINGMSAVSLSWQLSDKCRVGEFLGKDYAITCKMKSAATPLCPVPSDQMASGPCIVICEASCHP